MKCPLTRAIGATPRPLNLRRTLFALVAAAVVLPLGAAVALPPPATAKYTDGVCELRVRAVSQAPSTQSRRGTVVTLELQLDVMPTTVLSRGTPLPTDYYVDNDATPLVAASVGAGKSVTKTVHSWSTEGKSGKVMIADLEIGEASPRLQGVEFEVVLTKVTGWDAVAFQVNPGRSDFLLCGAFELRTTGLPERLQIDACAYPQFRKEHEAYRVGMPLNFLNQVYAMDQLKVVDAADRGPTSMGSSIPANGAASSTYTAWRPLENANPAKVALATDDNIVYPVSVTVRLPKRFEKERVRFRFNEILLPAPVATAR